MEISVDSSTLASGPRMPADILRELVAALRRLPAEDLGTQLAAWERMLTPRMGGRQTRPAFDDLPPPLAQCPVEVELEEAPPEPLEIEHDPCLQRSRCPYWAPSYPKTWECPKANECRDALAAAHREVIAGLPRTCSANADWAPLMLPGVAGAIEHLLDDGPAVVTRRGTPEGDDLGSVTEPPEAIQAEETVSIGDTDAPDECPAVVTSRGTPEPPSPPEDELPAVSAWAGEVDPEPDSTDDEDPLLRHLACAKALWELFGAPERSSPLPPALSRQFRAKVNCIMALHSTAPQDVPDGWRSATMGPDRLRALWAAVGKAHGFNHAQAAERWFHEAVESRLVALILSGAGEAPVN